MKNLKSKQVILLKKIGILQIQGRLSNEQDKAWSESRKRIQVWVIEKSKFALAHYSCKTAAENFDRHAKQRLYRLCAKVIQDKN